MRFLIFWMGFVGFALAGPVLEIVNQQGQSLEGEVLSITEQAVKIRRASDKRVFDLKLSTLSEGTVSLLESKKDEIGMTHPEYEFDVSISKRRKKQSGSWYMVNMEIAAKVSTKNTDRVLDSPGLKGKMIIIGQDQRDVSLFKILAAQEFDVAPKAGKTMETQLPSFVTSYDSDNKGEGNIGGYKYEGYVLLVKDAKGKLLYSKSLTPSFQKALEEEAGLVDSLWRIKKDKKVGKNLLPF